MGPVVSPSSSTASQAESHPIMSMLERDVPRIEVVPATPQAVDEERARAHGQWGAEGELLVPAPPLLWTRRSRSMPCIRRRTLRRWRRLPRRIPSRRWRK
ncbi:hypothetical protein B0H12DRAFT_1122602 [Mycena haematopus]|nr:hypothetical protein B0H12DRAFT_1122602 [Mycena haematopus]